MLLLAISSKRLPPVDPDVDEVLGDVDASAVDSEQIDSDQ
jgi:hypothetical protein